MTVVLNLVHEDGLPIILWSILGVLQHSLSIALLINVWVPQAVHSRWIWLLCMLVPVRTLSELVEAILC